MCVGFGCVEGCEVGLGIGIGFFCWDGGGCVVIGVVVVLY